MEQNRKPSDCQTCNVKQFCILDRRILIDRKCYIDELAEKLKKSTLQIMKLFNDFAIETGYEIERIPRWYANEITYWNMLDERSKYDEIRELIKNMQNKRKKHNDTYIPCTNKKFNEFCTTIVALLNTYFNAWRNEAYVKCLCCGKVFENNKQHNRKYCDDCRGYQRKIYVWRTCPDCGEEFKVKAPNNRQYRCPECQRDADKLAARQRAKKYRERKNHGIN